MVVCFEAINRTATEQAKDQLEEKSFGNEIMVCKDQYTKSLLLPNPESTISALIALANQFEDPDPNNKLREAIEGRGKARDEVVARQLLSCIYRNIATISQDLPPKDNDGNMADERFLKELPHFQKSLLFNAQDPELWMRLSRASRRAGYLKLARWGLERCLGSCSSTSLASKMDLVMEFKSPIKWKSLTQLIEVLYEIGDFSSCERWVELALSVYPTFPHALWAKDRIRSVGRTLEEPSVMKRKLDPLILPAAKRISCTLDIEFEKDDWTSLGIALLDAYKTLEKEPRNENGSGLRRCVRVIAIEPIIITLSDTEDVPKERTTSPPKSSSTSTSISDSEKFKENQPNPPKSKGTSFKKRVTRASTSLTQGPKPRDSPALELTRQVMDLFAMVGYTFSSTDPGSTLDLFSGSVEVLEELVVAGFGLELGHSGKNLPLDWLRRHASLMMQGTGPTTKKPSDFSILPTPHSERFVQARNPRVAEDWLLEYLYATLETLDVDTGILPQPLAGILHEILVLLTPHMLPSSFALKEGFELEFMMRACELLSPKPNQSTPSDTDGLDPLQIWVAKLKEIWLTYPVDATAHRETLARYWWFQASHFSTSDPQNELDSLQELKRQLEPPFQWNLPHSTYGQKVTPATLDEKLAQAELRCLMLKIENRTDLGRDEALTYLTSLTCQLNSPTISPPFRLKLVGHIVLLCESPCLSDLNSLHPEAQAQVIQSKLACHLELLESHICQAFRLMSSPTHPSEKESNLFAISDLLEKISTTSGIVAGMLDHDHVRSHFGTYLTSKDIRILAQASIVLAQLGFSLFLESRIRDHVSLNSKSLVQNLLVHTIKLIVNTLVALSPQPSSSNTTTSGPELKLALSKFLTSAHTHLGPYGACEIHEGILPKLCLRAFYQVEDSAVDPNDVYQCYYCLYHIVVGGTLKEKAKHTLTPQPLDMAAVGGIFRELWPNIETKVLRGKIASPEVKAALDRLNQYLGDTPLVHSAPVCFNMATIESYLQSDLHLITGIEDLNLPPLQGMEIAGGPSRIDWVYTKLFLSQARLQYYQIRVRIRVRNNANEVEWDPILEPIKRHLSFSPTSVEGWYYLALVYVEASSGMMRTSATYMRTHRLEIADLQRRGLMCFAEGARLMQATRDPDFTQHHEFWSEFAYLVYVATSRPMKMSAFQSGGEVSSAGTTDLLEMPPVPLSKRKCPTMKGCYRMAYCLFERALEIKNTWEINMMMGKCLSKMRSPPIQVLAYHYAAVHSSPTDVIEPAYQLLAFLYKSTLNGTLSDATIRSTLSNIPRFGVQPQSPISSLFIQALESLKSIDKQKWQHKLYYLHAKILNGMVQDPKRALDEIQNLIKVGSGILKVFINVWMPELERPGKHYVYVTQYLTFILDICSSNATPAFLYGLLRKVARNQDSIYRLTLTWEKGIEMYIKATRAQLQVRSSQFLIQPWTLHQFQQIVAPFEKTIISRLAHTNPEAVEVEMEEEYQVYLGLKCVSDLVKLYSNIVPSHPTTSHSEAKNGSGTDRKSALDTLLVDVYAKLLGMFQFDIGLVEVPSTANSNGSGENRVVGTNPSQAGMVGHRVFLTLPGLTKWVDRFLKEFQNACK